MRVLRATGDVGIVWAMSLLAAAAAFFTWFAWKWGAHYAGVWWRGVRERLEAGDTTIDQASWWMRDRWETLGRVLDGPKINADSATEMLAVIGAGSVLVMVLRLPGSVLAGWLGRRAIRRDGVLCDPALARRLGRRVYVDGALRWGVLAGLVWGAALALVNHLSQFGEYMQERETRMLAMLLTPLVIPVIDVVCSLRWARHRIAKDIRGRQRLCRWCGYDVTSLGEGVCSECGNRVQAKRRDVGVRVVRPHAARVMAAGVAALFMIAAGFGWAIANVKGIRVWDEMGRAADALMLKRRDKLIHAYLPAGRVMELRYDSASMLVCVPIRSQESTTGAGGEPGCRVRMLIRRERGEPAVERVEGVVTRTRPWIAGGGSVQIYPTTPEGVYLPRIVRAARLVEPDMADVDMAWVVGQ